MEEKALVEFGRRVQFIRKEKGLSQEVLANMSGVSRKHISNIENGKVNIKLIMLLQLQKALRVPISELVE